MYNPGILLVLFIIGACNAFTFQHPGVVVNQAQLDYMKKQVLAKQEPFISSFEQAVGLNLAALDYKPKGPPSDGIIDCVFPNLITGALPMTMMQGLPICRFGYAQNLKGYNDSNAKVQAGWSGGIWSRAAELVRHINAGWADSDIKAFEDHLVNVYLPLIYNGSTFNGNWELCMIDAMMGIAVFTENEDLLNHAVGFWQQRVPSYFYYEPKDGDKPVHSPRGDAYWYGETVFNSSVTGLCQETCRDLGHTQLGIAGMINGAETAHIQGFQLYESEADRIMAGLEFNARLCMGGKPQSYLCGNGTVNSGYQYPTWEIAYNEFHNRLGHDLPNTYQQIITHVRTMNGVGGTPLISVFETLTHGGSP